MVYPRVCGGTGSAPASVSRRTGLSPRVRGNLLTDHSQHVTCWSIPACAGEPGQRRKRACHGMVYPRVCGGTCHIWRQRRHEHGLSPRVRGNLDPGQRPFTGAGSIPACAGEPQITSDSAKIGEVYPRVCGGTHSVWPQHSRLGGLSPRVRGNLQAVGHVRALGGSIPACAGEPRRGSGLRAVAGVYPRVCGGTCLHRSSPPRISGLSPRVRGNLGME